MWVLPPTQEGEGEAARNNVVRSAGKRSCPDLSVICYLLPPTPDVSLGTRSSRSGFGFAVRGMIRGGTCAHGPWGLGSPLRSHRQCLCQWVTLTASHTKAGFHRYSPLKGFFLKTSLNSGLWVPGSVGNWFEVVARCHVAAKYRCWQVTAPSYVTSELTGDRTPRVPCLIRPGTRAETITRTCVTRTCVRLRPPLTPSVDSSEQGRLRGENRNVDT